MKGSSIRFCFTNLMPFARFGHASFLILLIMLFLYLYSGYVQACASLEPSYQPPVTFIVVQKRHHTRLFSSNHKDGNSTDKSGNILPGNNF